jgi:glycosyltransferase involved in cell wall biosynthesis
MKENLSIDIVTITKDDIRNLEMTFESILKLKNKSTISLNWIVVDSGQLLRGSDLYKSIMKQTIFPVNYLYQKNLGIYQAMNLGVSNVDSKYFIILNSGDVVRANLPELLVSLPSDKVSCFQSKWHNEQMQTLDYRTNYRVYTLLGRMPNHQAMVFPKTFKEYKYDENLRISADQDLKLKLAKMGKLNLRGEFLVSSLFGGLSTRRMSFDEFIYRTKESFLVFDANFNVAWALFLTIMYSLKLSTRIGWSNISNRKPTNNE